MKSFCSIVAVSALMCLASGAQAAFINGTASLSGNALNAPGAGATNVVGPSVFGALNTTAYNVLGVGDLTNGTGSSGFFGVGSPGLLFDYNGFSFSMGTWTNTSPASALICGSGLCTQTQTYSIAGSVDDGPGGKDATQFLGSFTLSGSCSGEAGTCRSSSQVAWSSSLTALGIAPPPPQQVPEPASMALTGLALGVLATLRRRGKA